MRVRGALLTAAGLLIGSGAMASGAAGADRATSDLATSTLSRSFGELLQPPAAAPSSRASTRVQSYLDATSARVVDAQGRRGLLLSSAPLLGRDAQGAQRPVDLTLRPDGTGRLAPTSSAVVSSIATDPTGGFTVGPDASTSVQVTPVDVDASASPSMPGGSVLFAGTHPDSDLLLRPQADGVETFEQLRGAGAPDAFSYRLSLRAGQTAALDDGTLLVRDGSGRQVLTVPPPVALDADRQPVPAHLKLAGDVVTVAVGHRTGAFHYPIMVDPDWSSTYDYAGQPGLGLQGWNVDYGPTGAAPFYDAFVNNRTDPATDPTGEALGFFIRPRVGAAGVRTFPVGAYGRLAFNAPGTTHIRSVAFTNVSRFNDRDRQTLRLGLYGDGFSDIDDVFDAQVLSEDPVVLPRAPFDPAADTPAKSAVIWMFTAPCDPVGDENCPPILRAGTRSLLRVGTVDLLLTDYDNPSTALAGSLGDIAGRWTSTTDDRTLAVSAQDPGSGIDHLDLFADDGTERTSVFSRQADCHPDHDQTDPPQGNTICPATLSTPDGAPLTIRTGGLREGKTTFTAEAGDYAGNPSGATSAATSVYLDRRAPSTDVQGELADEDGGYVVASRPATVRVTGQDIAGGQNRNSGVASIHLVGRDTDGDTVYDRTAQTCDSAAADGEHPCEPGRSATFTVDLRRLPEERVNFAATSTDLAGNESEPQRFDVDLDRTPPAARALGDLVDLQDRYTNREGQVQVQLQGRDAASGVRDLLLVARNADGDQVLRSQRVCDQADIDTSGACPHLASRTVTVDAGELPDGRTSFVARAVDLAGLQSVDGTDWNNYVDHTPPAAPDRVIVDGVSTDTVQVSWPAVSDQPEGAGQVSYEYLVIVNGEPVGGWRPTNDTSTQVGGLPPGVTVQTLVRAIDSAQNVGRPTAGAGITANLLLARPNAQAASAASNDSLAQRFRPVLLFDSSEVFRPLNVDEFIRHTKLRICPDQQAKDAGNCTAVNGDSATFNRVRTPSSLLDQVGPKRTDVGGHHTDISGCYGDDGGDCKDGRQGGWYYQVPTSPSPVPYRFINYWAFYRYNDAPFGDVAKGLRHEGDWEGVSVAVPRGGSPTAFSYVGFTAHGKLWRYLNAGLRCNGSDSRCGPGRARVNDYVGQGTHANYPFSCSRFILNCKQTAAGGDGGRSSTPEAGHDGKQAWSLNNVSRTLGRLPNADQNPWVGWPGNWNEDSAPQVFSPAAPRDADSYDRYSKPWATVSRPVNRPSERAAVRAAPTPEHAEGIGADCDSWQGPGVAASLCEPQRLADALERGTVEAPTSPELAAGARSAAAGDGIAQVTGTSLQPGDAVTIGRQPDPDAEVRAQITAPAASTVQEVAFTGVGSALAAGGQLRVTAQANGANATITTPSGRTIRPSSMVAVALPARPVIRSATVRGRRIALVVRATTARTRIEVARGCRAPTLASTTVSGRPGASRRVTVSRSGTVGARYVRVTAVDGSSSSQQVCRRARR